MNNEIKIRLAKLRELAERGATEGEKKAARKGMERLIKKYNLEEINIDWDGKLDYRFKYNTNLELWLMLVISEVLVYVPFDDKVKIPWNKEVEMSLKYLDYITMECAYEYFRRHMKKEWNRTAIPILKKCRKPKTKNKKREILQGTFFTKYIKASGLYKDELFKSVNMNASEHEAASRIGRVEGGKYNSQVNNGLYLES